MKKTLLTLAAWLATMAAAAQTLNVSVGSMTDQYPATQAGEMTYTSGTELTILNKTYTLSDITRMWTDDTAVTDNEVSVVYSGTEASVYVAGNIARYVTVSVSGAHVRVVQSTDVDATVGEITYALTGTSADGEFYMEGSYKATVELNGVTLTNANPVYSGAAVGIKNGKRINISVKKDTENTLADAASSTFDQKAALYVKGHAELKGKGTLNVYGNYAHAIKAGEYITVKNCTVNVLKSVKDGINCNQYFLMESGTLGISGVGDDGIQADIDEDETATAETADHEDENSGNVYLQGGTVTATITTSASKGIKAAGDMSITGGTITVTTTGVGTYDSTERDAKGCAGLKSDSNMSISGGTLTLKSTGTGGKCIKADGTLAVSGDAVISATSTGNIYKYSNSITASPKAIKSDGAMTITGGTITASSSYHEAIETKSTLDISGGTVSATAKDDAINSSSHFTITGGYVMGYSTGNDGLDANGNLYIKGGVVYAIGSTSPEVAVDANTEGGYKLYVTGGTLITCGPLESGSSLTQSCYQASSWSKNTWYALYDDGNLVLAVKTPSSGGNGMVVSTAGTPTLKSGVTVTGGTEYFGGMGNVGGTVSGGSSVSLSAYSGNSGGGPGGGGPGGGGPGGGGHR